MEDRSILAAYVQCLTVLVYSFITIFGVACHQANNSKANENERREQSVIPGEGNVYEGFICVGYEQNFFVQNPLEIFDWSDQYTKPWVEFDRNIPEQIIEEVYRQAVLISGEEKKISESKAIWVRVVGKQEDKENGGFGHLNAYDKRLIIKQIINYSPDPVNAAIKLKKEGRSQ